jgi:hypothetical protein
MPVHMNRYSIQLLCCESISNDRTYRRQYTASESYGEPELSLPSSRFGPITVFITRGLQ